MSPPLDEEISSTSANAVENRAIYRELQALSDRIGSVESPAQTAIKLAFSIATSAWTGSGPYTYTFTSSSIGTNSLVLEPMITSGFSALPPSWSWTQITNGVTFTVATLPTATIAGDIPVIDSVNGIVPIERGGTGAASALDARVNLGVPAHGIVIVSGEKATSTALTISNSNITANHQLLNYFVATPANEAASWTWTTAAGTLTIEGTFLGSTNMTFILGVPY